MEFSLQCDYLLGKHCCRIARLGPERGLAKWPTQLQQYSLTAARRRVWLIFLTSGQHDLVWCASGLIAVARLSQGIRPRTALRPCVGPRALGGTSDLLESNPTAGIRQSSRANDNRPISCHAAKRCLTPLGDEICLAATKLTCPLSFGRRGILVGPIALLSCG